MDATPPVGQAEEIAPALRRVLAPNPGPFTGTGTGTFLVGRGEVAVIDPGPDDAAHIAALLRALAGERVAVILVTHTHRDHSPAARALAATTGAPVVGCAPLAFGEGGVRVEAGFDPDYAPDRVLADVEAVAGPGWTLRALATPGHTSNHLSFAWEEVGALFTGDHVMGWSTTVVAPPDGSMGAYMASLEGLLARNDRVYYPTHGPAVADPRRLVRGHLVHRRQRERQILALLSEGGATIPAMVAAMYAGVDRRLWPAAGLSVRAHLIDLAGRGLARADGADIWVGT